MQLQTIKTFSFSELSESAKDSVLSNSRNINTDYDWHNDDDDDFKSICSLLGIDVDNIYYSGFSSQGDGACFEGAYTYKSGLLKAIKEYAPIDKELHRIAKQLQLVKYRGVSATIKHSGHYYHEYCTDIAVYQEDKDGYSDDDAPIELSDEITELMRDLMRWLYKSLESQYEYLTSDEAIIETIEANDYQFTEDGELF